MKTLCFLYLPFKKAKPILKTTMLGNFYNSLKEWYEIETNDFLPIQAGTNGKLNIHSQTSFSIENYNLKFIVKYEGIKDCFYLDNYNVERGKVIALSLKDGLKISLQDLKTKEYLEAKWI